MEYLDPMVSFVLAWEMIIRLNRPLPKQEPLTSTSQAESMGWHCTILKMVSMALKRKRKTIAAWRGPIRAFVIGIRMGNRRIETLVHIRVTNV
jgi:hypothetical protein